MPENTANIPFLSIVTVAKDNLNGLSRTHSSIQGQTCQDLEWIVIDGDSGTQTTDFMSQNSKNWISEPDAGIYDAMNKGIERAKGEYVLFLNAGDLFKDNTVLEQIKAKAAKKPAFIFGDSCELGAYKPAREPQIEFGMFTHHQAMLYRRDKIGALRYDLKYSISSDYDFTSRFLENTPDKLYVPMAICDFEPGGISQQQASKGRKEQYEIRKELGLCSDTKNAAITAAQACLWRLRALFPNLYWHLKSSGNKQRVEVRT